MTAAVYARALLQHGYGVDLRSIRWFQAGVNEPGRADKLQIRPEGFSITSMPDRSLSEMLCSGDLDAAISARPPKPFEQGDKRIVRACKDLMAEELAYWKASRIFPIMHMIVIRREVYERNRWIALNLLRAFEEAKQRSLARIREVAASHLPIPWIANHVALAQAEMGEDFWPYGIEPNRTTLEAFCRFGFEQGSCARLLNIEELFAPETQAQWRV
jgi:4,5-dihydroxyphthalate decarboxylase